MSLLAAALNEVIPNPGKTLACENCGKLIGTMLAGNILPKARVVHSNRDYLRVACRRCQRLQDIRQEPASNVLNLNSDNRISL